MECLGFPPGTGMSFVPSLLGKSKAPIRGPSVTVTRRGRRRGTGRSRWTEEWTQGIGQLTDVEAWWILQEGLESGRLGRQKA